MRNRALLIAFSSLLVVLAACGGSSSSDKTAAPKAAGEATAGKSPAASSSAAAGKTTTTATPEPSKDETAFAKSMLLSADDFPSGWVETPNTTDTEDNPVTAQCGKAAEKGKTGRATSSDFAAGENSASIGEDVIVFARDDAAAAGIEAVPALIDCAVKLINDGKVNNADIEFSGTTSKKIMVDAPGDRSYAFQIQMTGKAAVQPDQEVTVYLTLVFAKKGRVGYQLTAQRTGEPPDPAEVAAYATKAAAKLKQQP
jgi:hypothetical protein